MLDVHPPHHAANSWRDFFIHIATIVVGLLIAVGLEQTVEAIHRHHERSELEDRLRRQAEDNIAPLDAGRKSWQRRIAWEATTVSMLRTAPEKDGFITVALPTYEFGGSQTIQRAAWSVAKANGTLALLPEPEEEVFDRVDWFAEQENVAFNNSHQAQLEEDAAEAAAGVDIEPGTTLRFPAAQRDSLVRGMARMQATTSQETRWLTGCEAADMAIRENPQNAVEFQTAEHLKFLALGK